jgi:hypothetical protein
LGLTDVLKEDELPRLEVGKVIWDFTVFNNDGDDDDNDDNDSDGIHLGSCTDDEAYKLRQPIK